MVTRMVSGVGALCTGLGVDDADLGFAGVDAAPLDNDAGLASGEDGGGGVGFVHPTRPESATTARRFIARSGFR